MSEQFDWDTMQQSAVDAGVVSSLDVPETKQPMRGASFIEDIRDDLLGHFSVKAIDKRRQK